LADRPGEPLLPGRGRGVLDGARPAHHLPPVDLRIDTVVDYRGAKEKGVKSLGTTDAGGLPALAELATLAATGDLHIPIAATYPLTAVRDAYQALAGRKPHGRIVLHPQDLG
jgi:NADPH:quinone reductase-like Zn-dependent oxidoreductase